jgi:Zn-dependent alcohol dehydrogenase
MKTTIELPDPLFRRAKVLAARRGATLRDLVVEGLRHVTGSGAAANGAPLQLTREEAAVATIGAHGLPVLKRSEAARKQKVTLALVDRLRDELSV